MNRLMAGAVVLGLLAQTAAFGNGLLIPKDGSVPPLAIKSQRVDIRIKDGVATTRIEQVFKNSVDRDLEAVYVFPLPENASISDFAMYIGGKRVSGELVEKEKARQIYQDIVRRMRDPGLLEHLGGNLFRVSVYPVPKNGEQKMELEYSQTMVFEAGLYKFVYPLKTGEATSKTLEDFTVGARIQSSQPIKTVYSPSHKVGLTRKGENEATVGFEEDKSCLDRDFELYYGVSKKEFGLNLLAHAVKGQDGFFMMMLAPSVAPKDTKISKDVIFVLDASGSMEGQKIDQARKALEYCVRKLNSGDRFNIIRFSTDVETFKDGLTEVGEKACDEAIKFVKQIEARGGTAIDGALQAALAMVKDKKRPAYVVFLTDGKPTIGECDIEDILKNVDTRKGKDADASSARIFVFGVGDEVNTHLLDRLSGKNGGVSQYVKPGEDIEVKVSALADKISQPVLAHPVVTIDTLKTRHVHPQTLFDLFAGEQILIFGRYAGDGHVAIRLTGDVNGEKKEYVFEGTFPESNADNGFIPRLWATRRVGYLLDEIRLKGEERELKDEVVRLGKEYGIMTPYTSYLVLENDQAYRDHGIDRPAPAAPLAAAREAPAVWTRRSEVHAAPAKSAGGKAGNGWAEAEKRPAEERDFVPMFQGTADAIAAPAAGPADGSDDRKKLSVTKADEAKVHAYLKESSGARAVELSETIQRYKQRQGVEEDAANVRHVGKKIFYRIRGMWVDSEYKEGMKEAKVSFGSDEYFKTLDRHPELKSAFALGEKVLVCLTDGSAVRVE